MSAGEFRQRVEAVKARVALSALIGRAVKLTRRGGEHVGLCPFHTEGTPSFTVADAKGFYHCFGCGAHGDAIDFVREHEGLSVAEALNRLERDAGLASESAAAKRDSLKENRSHGDLVGSREAAAAIWKAAGPARGELPEAWLRARGIDPQASGLLDVAKFHPDCPAQLWLRWEQPGDARRRAPALVCPIVRIGGGPGERAFSLIGLHLTFLAPDGRSKARFAPWRSRSGEWVTPPARVMWGGSGGGAVPIPSARILPPTDPKEAMARLIDLVELGPIVVGEGIESTASLMARHDSRIGFATLSLGNLQGRASKAGPNGSLQLWNVAGEPAQEGGVFTFERPGGVVLGVDSDMKPTAPQWVQDRPRAAAVKRALSGRERAELCGMLAAWHWRAAGATRVAVVRPPMGHDFNDLDRAEAA